MAGFTLCKNKGIEVFEEKNGVMLAVCPQNYKTCINQDILSDPEIQKKLPEQIKMYIPNFTKQNTELITLLTSFFHEVFYKLQNINANQKIFNILERAKILNQENITVHKLDEASLLKICDNKLEDYQEYIAKNIDTIYPNANIFDGKQLPTVLTEISKMICDYDTSDYIQANQGFNILSFVQTFLQSSSESLDFTQNTQNILQEQIDNITTILNQNYVTINDKNEFSYNTLLITEEEKVIFANAQIQYEAYMLYFLEFFFTKFYNKIIPLSQVTRPLNSATLKFLLMHYNTQAVLNLATDLQNQEISPDTIIKILSWNVAYLMKHCKKELSSPYMMLLSIITHYEKTMEKEYLILIVEYLLHYLEAKQDILKDFSELQENTSVIDSLIILQQLHNFYVANIETKFQDKNLTPNILLTWRPLIQNILNNLNKMTETE
jgi:hypothetical protein